ncbi:MAG TPA: PHP-associated domain-containing protein [Candidatus Binataceae bacterium]|nr:PHP-associated domain-containing protein [Candidatus Binataceae bacterium]
MLIDLHVHTLLSSDSNVAPERYVEAAAGAPRRLDAICFTEHRLFPTDAELDRRYAELSEKFGVMVFKGIEADTNLGHLLLFGITAEVMRRFDLTARMLKSDALIEVVHGEGGVAIPAHPFRDSGFGAQLDDLLARHGPALGAIEALNGQNSARENEAALTATEKLGLTGVGGSDAHFASAKWFLTCATELERAVSDVAGLCAELRAGRARPFRFAAAADPAAAT